jgi:hypothetical protein
MAEDVADSAFEPGEILAITSTEEKSVLVILACLFEMGGWFLLDLDMAERAAAPTDNGIAAPAVICPAMVAIGVHRTSIGR